VKPDSVGLGLAVARQLAQMMGGDLVYKRQDGWTRFELTLPTPPQPVASLTV
jgi:signal transduction histidine kinase